MPRPKHHYVPRFYLERFANPKGQIKMFDRSKDKAVTTNVKNVASETEYYTVFDASGERSERVEEFLSKVEGEVSRVLARHDVHDARLNRNDRVSISLLIALQLVRTPHWRAWHADSVDLEFRMLLELNVVGRSRDQVRAYLKEVFTREPEEADIDLAIEVASQAGEFRISPNSNMYVKTMLEIAPELGQLLFLKPWTVYKCETREFITSDQPIALWREDDPDLGIGIATADQIYFPIDPYTVLSLNTLSSGEPASITIEQCDVETTRRINHVIAHGALRWIYFHPKHHNPLQGMVLPPQVPIANVNGLSVFEGESTWDELRKEWMPKVERVRREQAQRAPEL